MVVRSSKSRSKASATDMAGRKLGPSVAALVCRVGLEMWSPLKGVEVGVGVDGGLLRKDRLDRLDIDVCIEVLAR